MDEFSLINTFFKSISFQRKDVIFGIGDDAACLTVPEGMQLLVSCDTLIADVHFLSSWDAYDIAYKAVMVNVSDIAAMGGTPSWLTLALTLPSNDEQWLRRFSQGLHDSLNQYHIALIGGDTTRGSLSITLTIHGLIPTGKAVRRNGASPGDIIYVSGELGGAALAVTHEDLEPHDKTILMKKLQRPTPRIDLTQDLRAFATSAIDISDGFSADLHHICEESRVGATLDLAAIPLHPLVRKYEKNKALAFALSGGDDYELCFTVAPHDEKGLLNSLSRAGISCYRVGVMDEKSGLRGKALNGELIELTIKGYQHF